MAVVWRCHDVSLGRGRSHRRCDAKLPALRDRRPGRLDLCRDGGLGGGHGPTSLRRRPGRPARTGAGRDGAQYRRNRAAALGARHDPRRPRYPVRALPGDRRLSRRDRLAHDARRHPGGDRPPAAARRLPHAFRRCLRSQARGRAGRRDRASACAITLEQSVSDAGDPRRRRAGSARRRTTCRHHASRSTGRRMDVPAAACGRTVVALAACGTAKLPLGRTAVADGRPAGGDVRHHH